MSTRTMIIRVQRLQPSEVVQLRWDGASELIRVDGTKKKGKEKGGSKINERCIIADNNYCQGEHCDSQCTVIAAE